MKNKQELTVWQKLNAVLELLDEGEPETAEKRRAYLVERGYDPDTLIKDMRNEIELAIIAKNSRDNMDRV